MGTWTQEHGQLAGGYQPQPAYAYPHDPYTQPQYGAQPHPRPHVAFAQPQYAAQPHPGQPMVAGYGAAPVLQPYGYAFPTTHGIHMLPHSGARVVGYRWRLRWENIVPMLAGIAFLVAAVLFVRSYDDISRARGAGSNATAAAAGTAATNPAAAAMSAAEISAELTKARALIDRGDYEAAQLIVHPLMEHADDNPQIAQLHEQLDRREQLNARLLARLGRDTKAGRWADMLATITKIEQLHPLTPRQKRARRAAEHGKAVDAAVSNVRRLFQQGKLQDARAAVTRALRRFDDPRLRRLQEQIQSRLNASPSGGGAGTRRPPATNTGSTTTPPPSTSPPAVDKPPAVPNVPNTGTGGNVGNPIDDGHGDQPVA